MSRAAAGAAKTRITLIGAGVNALLAVGKVVGGVFGQSQALIVDGVHSASDLASDALVLWAARMGRLGPDGNHPYGHARFETAATLGIGAILLLVAGGFAYDALERLLQAGTAEQPGMLALVVAVASVLTKEVLYRYTLRVAERQRSELMRANAWHHRSDALSSVVVIIGVLGAMAGAPWLDSVAALAVALMVGRVGWQLGWNAGRELVDTGLDSPQLLHIRQQAEAVEGVHGIRALRTRQMAAHILVDLRILVDPEMTVAEAKRISEAVRTRIRREVEGVAEVNVGIDPLPEPSRPEH